MNRLAGAQDYSAAQSLADLRKEIGTIKGILTSLILRVKALEED